MAKKRTQREWTELAVSLLEIAAHDAGILDQNVKLHYIPGSRTNGIAPQVQARDETLNMVSPQPRFIPTFYIKDTAWDVERIVNAIHRGLEAVITSNRS